MNGMRHDFGFIRYPDGREYMGMWCMNQRHGYGELIDSEKTIFQGTWKEHKMEGIFKLYILDKQKGVPEVKKVLYREGQPIREL